MCLFSGNLAVFRDAISFLGKNRDLAFAVGKREFSEWHVGQVFGMGRGLGRQLFIMTLDVFVFVIIFKATIGDTLEIPLDYMTHLLSGLVARMGLQESLVKSCTTITSISCLVRGVVFPLEILSANGVLVSFICHDHMSSSEEVVL